MIGVIAKPSDHQVVREFFELFKTPWEFCQNDQQYEVIICAGETLRSGNGAKLVLVYASKKLPFDTENATEISSEGKRNRLLSYKGSRIPLYCDCATFRKNGDNILEDEQSREPALHLNRHGGTIFARVGYDLFEEIRALLTDGQPTAHASIPALDLHIALLRHLITSSGVTLVEIPPVPHGYGFVACLTHDVDHPSVRHHKWDHTIFGFLYRAFVGSLCDLIGGRRSLRELAANWAAGLKLPFVYMGVAEDFWRNFDDRYLEIEKDLPSTFFVIPFRSRPGTNPDGQVPAFRAARYEAKDIAHTIQRLMGAGCEVGLHGIDAWLDSSKGHDELEEIRALTGVSEIGVRIHWLYFNGQSASALENAGASYDSTIGYNETVGYRTGTTQVYKPLDATRLLELPLHIMDTAMFYPNDRRHSPTRAKAVLRQMVNNAVQYGGALTVNWHDRSLAPERLWDAPYRELVQDLKNRGAWFATAGQAVSWFAKRRMAVFEADSRESSRVHVKSTLDNEGKLPGLRLRIHKGQSLSALELNLSDDYVDLSVDESREATVHCQAAT